MIVGIDLGTTNSLVAYFDGEKACVLENRLGEKLTPSVVSIDTDGTVYVGRTAQERGALYPLDTASVFKRSMGTNKEYRLAGKTLRAEELSSLVLRSLKEDAEAALGQPVEEAVISVPAYFNDLQRKATRRAGELAGLKVERIINEPTAAAVAYGLCEEGRNGTFLVFDLGGGTLDVSILELYDGIMEVHAIAGDNYLGGEDFTQALMELFAHKAKLDLTTLDIKNAFILRNQAENCKLALSDGLMAVMTCVIDGKSYSSAILRSEYEKACMPLFARIMKPVERGLRDADKALSDIDEIVLVGGATKSPLVRAFCKSIFERTPCTGVDPDQAIAVGAALCCGMKTRSQALQEIILTDVCPFSLGTEVRGPQGIFGGEGRFSPIIERNTVIPVSRTQRYCTTENGQENVRIQILQGESRIAQENLQLGEMVLPVPPGLAGHESVDVTFTYDINSLLEVEAIVVSTGVCKKVLIRGYGNHMTDAEAQLRMEQLQKLKINPRDQEENRLLLFQGARLYEEAQGERRWRVDAVLNTFEEVMAHGSRAEIYRARQQLREALARLKKEQDDQDKPDTEE